MSLRFSGIARTEYAAQSGEQIVNLHPRGRRSPARCRDYRDADFFQDYVRARSVEDYEDDALDMQIKLAALRTNALIETVGSKLQLSESICGW